MERDNSSSGGSNRSLGKFMEDLLRQRSFQGIPQGELIIVNDNASTQFEHSTPPSPVLQKVLARGSSKSSLDTANTTSSTCTSTSSLASPSGGSSSRTPVCPSILRVPDSPASILSDSNGDYDQFSPPIAPSLLLFGGRCRTPSSNTTTSSPTRSSAVNNRWRPSIAPVPPITARSAMKLPRRQISGEEYCFSPECSCHAFATMAPLTVVDDSQTSKTDKGGKPTAVTADDEKNREKEIQRGNDDSTNKDKHCPQDADDDVKKQFADIKEMLDDKVTKRNHGGKSSPTTTTTLRSILRFVAI